MTKRKYSIYDIVYLAGIVDGEGSIILERRTKLRPQEKSVMYSPRIAISNTDYRLMEWLKEKFGGNITKTKRGNNWKDCYAWGMSRSKAIELARMLMPYLKLKSVQAYCLSCYELEAVWTKGGKPEECKVSDEEIDRRDKLYQELKKLNRRGVEMISQEI